jgi:hypothetical protein
VAVSDQGLVIFLQWISPEKRERLNATHAQHALTQPVPARTDTIEWILSSPNAAAPYQILPCPRGVPVQGLDQPARECSPLQPMVSQHPLIRRYILLYFGRQTNGTQRLEPWIAAGTRPEPLWGRIVGIR